MNLYAYVGNNPLNAVDPDGREPQRVPGTNFNRHVVGSRAAPIDANLAVRYPGKGYDNQCAAGAQYLAGGNGRDAPNASNWERGSAVNANTPSGTMIARGWVPNSNNQSGYEYPNQSNVVQSGVSNHTVIFLALLESGNILVPHQYRESTGEKKGCAMHESIEPASNFYEVLTKLGVPTDRSTGTWGTPYGQ